MNSPDLLSVVIVEDEPHSRETLKNLLSDFCPGVEIAGMAGTVSDGIQEIKKKHPDLVFLDIELHKESGFDLLKKVYSLDFEVIFTTAYEHYALKAIKFSAIDYLLKPIDYEELQQAVEKVARRKETSLQNLKIFHLLQNFEKKRSDQDIITLATSEGLEFIKVSEIIRCEAEGSYTRFFLKDDRKLLVSRHLKEYENMLSEYHFFRIHQSTLINLAEVKKYVRSEGGYIVMNDESQVNIAHKRKEEFLQVMRGK